MDYVKGIKIYEAIVESKILETTQKQIKTLEKEANKIISDTTKAISTSTVVEARQQLPNNTQTPVPLPVAVATKNDILASLKTEEIPAPITQPIIQVQQPINLNKETTDIQISNLTNIPNNPVPNNPGLIV
jgi:hypothetical protein